MSHSHLRPWRPSDPARPVRLIAAIATLFVLIALEIVAAPAVFAKATLAPVFVAPTVDTDKTISLAALRGRAAVVVMFYQNACGVCREEFPHLIALSKTYLRQDVQFLAVPLETDRSAAGQWKREFHADFPFLYDPKFAIADAYRVDATPTTVLIDRHGALARVLVGADPKELDQAVSALAKRTGETGGTVAASAEAAVPLAVGSAVPAMTLMDVTGKPFALADAIAKRPTVLIFYRGGWCPFCNRQMAQLVEIEPKLRKMGYQLLAISPDRPEELRKSIAKHRLNYTLLSDSDATAIKAMGLAYRVDDSTLQKYREFGIDLEASSGRAHHLLPVPSVFLVDTTGVIRFRYANPDYRVRIAPDALLAAAKANQMWETPPAK